MNTQDLRKYVEFYRDLGIKDLNIIPQAHEEQNDVPQVAKELNKDPQMVDPEGVLQTIRNDIGDCTRCRLHARRNSIVFGSGNPDSKLVFVGEGPGADEDVQGLPFVGHAGQLLTKMIDGTCERLNIPIQRKDVYICNVVKCRPPENRAPEKDEMEICGQFMARQIQAIRPKAICVLGATAAKALLNTTQGITAMRGTWRDWNGIPVMPTFHPSYLLRQYKASAKRDAFEDLKKLFRFVYEEQSSEEQSSS